MAHTQIKDIICFDDAGLEDYNTQKKKKNNKKIKKKKKRN